MRTHGHTALLDKSGKRANSPSYRSWNSMKNRCLNKKDEHYQNYGGRGIFICERWMSFENFFSDMGMRPKGMTLDRINNNGPYAPENCRWATTSQQRNNTRFTKFLEFDGKKLAVSQWSKLLGLKRERIWARIKRGYPVENVLSIIDFRRI